MPRWGCAPEGGELPQKRLRGQNLFLNSFSFFSTIPGKPRNLPLYRSVSQTLTLHVLKQTLQEEEKMTTQLSSIGHDKRGP